MAVRATSDQVAADMRPTDYRKAVQTLRTIQPKKEKIGEINGTISGIFATVEGLKVNKKGARIFLALDRLEAADRADVIRTVTGLSDAAGWDAAPDLVDSAEGKDTVVKFPGGEKNAEKEKAEAKPPRSTTRNAAKAAQDRAKAHLGVPVDPHSQPYTGDNSDLNPE
jgi:hypothetical protein